MVVNNAPLDQQSKTSVSTERILSFDCLRILAMFGVILLHVTAQNWGAAPVTSPTWFMFNVFNSASRWAVSVFVMISGTLFLNPDKKFSTRKMYQKNLGRIVIAYLFWSLLYALLYRHHTGTRTSVLSSVIAGPGHMWFLHFLTGLYIFTPVLRKMTESKKLTEYFLILGLVMCFLVPRLATVLQLFVSNEYSAFFEAIETISESVYFHFTGRFVFYYVLGFYLYKYPFGRKLRRVVWVAGALGWLAMALLTAWYSVAEGSASELFYPATTFGTLTMATAVYTAGIYCIPRVHFHPKIAVLIRHLSKCSFGIYMIHAQVIESLRFHFGLHTLAFSPVLSVPLICALVFVISYLISAGLNRIPFLNKYIV